MLGHHVGGNQERLNNFVSLGEAGKGGGGGGGGAGRRARGHSGKKKGGRAQGKGYSGGKKGGKAGGRGLRSAFAFLQSAAWLSYCMKMAQREATGKEGGGAGRARRARQPASTGGCKERNREEKKDTGSSNPKN